MPDRVQRITAHNSASNAIPNCKAPKTPHYSLVQRASRATRCKKLSTNLREEPRGKKNKNKIKTIEKELKQVYIIK